MLAPSSAIHTWFYFWATNTFLPNGRGPLVTSRGSFPSFGEGHAVMPESGGTDPLVLVPDEPIQADHTLRSIQSLPVV